MVLLNVVFSKLAIRIIFRVISRKDNFHVQTLVVNLECKFADVFVFFAIKAGMCRQKFVS